MLYNINKLYYATTNVLCSYDPDVGGALTTNEGRKRGIFTFNRNFKVGKNICEQGKEYYTFRFPRGLECLPFGIDNMEKQVGKHVIVEIVPLINVLRQFGIRCYDTELTETEILDLYNQIMEVLNLLEGRKRNTTSVDNPETEDKQNSTGGIGI